MTTDEQTLRAQLAAARQDEHATAAALRTMRRRVAALKAALGALLLPHLPVGTIIERVSHVRHPQQYVITHHDLYDSETAVAYMVPLNTDGTRRDTGGRWLKDWIHYRVVSVPPPKEPGPLHFMGL